MVVSLLACSRCGLQVLGEMLGPPDDYGRRICSVCHDREIRARVEEKFGGPEKCKPDSQDIIALCEFIQTVEQLGRGPVYTDVRRVAVRMFRAWVATLDLGDA